jgi:hypothetical protein
MNYYPGEGLGIGTAILGSTVGQRYPEGILFPTCKLFGTIITPAGSPVGSASTTLVNSTTGTRLVSTWKGVTVTAALTIASEQDGDIIGAATVSAETNACGYFELIIVQDLTVTVTCPSFGKSILVDTTGLDSIDLSTFFT